jgi:hypothetical protein
MYRYTERPKCGREALLSAEPEQRDANAYSGQCRHCGAEFTFHPVEPETPLSTRDKQ